jgi:hypothetical protein
MQAVCSVAEILLWQGAGEIWGVGVLGVGRRNLSLIESVPTEGHCGLEAQIP